MQEALMIITGVLIILVIAWIVSSRIMKRQKELYDKDLKVLEDTINKLTAAPAQTQVNVNMKPLEDAIKAIPTKVLQSIQSSTNTRKGALGELIGYIELEAEYDRIIPLGNIVDFMCIKFPEISKTGMRTDGTIPEGRIDFVDIKTGKSARLSKDQRMLQQLIKDKKINFVKVTVNTQTSENDTQID